MIANTAHLLKRQKKKSEVPTPFPQEHAGTYDAAGTLSSPGVFSHSRVNCKMDWKKVRKRWGQIREDLLGNAEGFGLYHIGREGWRHCQRQSYLHLQNGSRLEERSFRRILKHRQKIRT